MVNENKGKERCELEERVRGSIEFSERITRDEVERLLAYLAEVGKWRVRYAMEVCRVLKYTSRRPEVDDDMDGPREEPRETYGKIRGAVISHKTRKRFIVRGVYEEDQVYFSEITKDIPWYEEEGKREVRLWNVMNQLVNEYFQKRTERKK